MTCKEKLRKLHPEWNDELFFDVIKSGCPDDYFDIEEIDHCEPFTSVCEKCWNREIPEEKGETNMDCIHAIVPRKSTDDVEKNNNEHWEPRPAFPSAPQILDSGNRTQFETGAVRDMREGKGRCDLTPLEVVSKMIDPDGDTILDCIRDFQKTRDSIHLYDALGTFTAAFNNQMETLILEVAKHFEEGAKKYGESNWRRGLPVWCYIDSAVRHYLKWLRGDKNEPHDRAFVWNLMCCIWEVDYHKTTVEGTENNETH